MSNILKDIEDGGSPLVKTGVACNGGISGMLTYAGMSIDAETFREVSLAATFSVAMMILTIMFWRVLLALTPRLKTTRDITMTALLSLPFLLAIFGFSGWNNVKGVSGRAALELHMQDGITEFEAAFDQAYADANALKTTGMDLSREARSFHADGDEEFETGGFSGHPGKGLIESVFHSVGDGFEDSARTVADLSQKNDESLVQAQIHLDKMRKIAASNIPLQERMRLMAEQSDKIRGLLIELDTRPAALTILRGLKGLKQNVSLRSNFSKNPATARRQKQALETIERNIEATTKTINKPFKTLSLTERADPPSFQKISASEAVAKAWPVFIGGIAGGIALDIFPAILVIYYLIALRTTSARERKLSVIMDMPLKDVLRGVVAKDLFKGNSLSREEAEFVFGEMLGRESNGERK